jgi:hypothetical protein
MIAARRSPAAALARSGPRITAMVYIRRLHKTEVHKKTKLVFIFSFSREKFVTLVDPTGLLGPAPAA